MEHNKPQILGVALGKPWSPATYSGVPFHLFDEFRRLGCLAAAVDGYTTHAIDVLTGRFDVLPSVLALHPKRNPLWRYSPRGMRTLSRRLRRIQEGVPRHNVVFQIGVGGIPTGNVKLVAHVEIPVASAVETEIFAKSYGFAGRSRKAVADAIENERRFLERCDLVWTNSVWTAKDLLAQGLEENRLVVYPPASGMGDPGVVDREWSELNVLFVGNDWHRKGGDLLLEAFEIVRQRRPKATLNIVGRTPNVKGEGVRTFGYLAKDSVQDREQLERLYREATVFCMPSYWDSTGIVYMEAALWGLPIVSLKGQGREEIFPPEMAVYVDPPTAGNLADALVQLAQSPDKMHRMGEWGRGLVLEKYTWQKVVQVLHEKVTRVVGQHE